MLSILLIGFMLVIFVTWLRWSYGLAKTYKTPPRKLRPEEFDWGDGKDLSYFLAKKTKLGELEQWYMDNHSKDARITELTTLVQQKSALIAKIQARLTVLERERHIVLSQESYYDYWKQDLRRSMLNSLTDHGE